MSAAEALWKARRAGIELRVEGCDLVLQALTPPPADLLERLARHKPEIVALLRPGRDGWSAEDWQANFDERAGIAEFDGGLPRLEAEAIARASVNGAPIDDDIGPSAMLAHAITKPTTD